MYTRFNCCCSDNNICRGAVHSPYKNVDVREEAGINSVYDGSISSTILNWFAGYYRSHYDTEDYLILRDGQYTYRMYVGSIVADGKTCILSNCDVVTYHSSSSAYDYTPYYSVASGVSTTIDITSGNQLSAYVYSDVVGSCVADIDAYRHDFWSVMWAGVIGLMMCIAALFVVVRGWLTRHDRKD